MVVNHHLKKHILKQLLIHKNNEGIFLFKLTSLKITNCKTSVKWGFVIGMEYKQPFSELDNNVNKLTF